MKDTAQTAVDVAVGYTAAIIRFPDKFPPMQQLAIDMMTESDWVRPHTLSHRWAELNGRRQWGSSRIMFGTTSAGYQTFYKLEKMGVCQSRRIGNHEIPDFEFSFTNVFLMHRKIQAAAKSIAAAGLSTEQLSKTVNGVSRELRKFGTTVWALTAVERYRLHRRAKRFGCVVHPRLHIININHKTLDSLKPNQRAVLDRLESIGYSIQIEI